MYHTLIRIWSTDDVYIRNNMVIINADDFGLSSSVNEAIVRCFNDNLIHRTTVMTNMPAFTEACELAERNEFKDKVGLHLVLNDGCPLTERIKSNHHFCKDGQFIQGWYVSIKRKFFLSYYDKECLREEIEAQMKAYCNAGYTLMHIDSHYLIHTSSPVLIDMVCELAKKYGFKSMRNVSLYSTDNIVYRIAKKYVARRIRQDFQTTVHFAPYCQYPLPLKDVEYMSHPDMVEGVVVDYENRRTGQYRDFRR